MFKETLISFSLTNADTQQLENIFTEKISLANGNFFIKENEVVDGIGFIVKGSCRYFYNINGNEITRWVSLEGEFITSLSSFIYRNPTNENIQAIRDTEIIFAKKQAWDELLGTNEALRRLWTHKMEALYVGMEERVHILITLNAEQRYKWMFENQPKFIAEVPDKYLASMLGITPRHLTRLRSKRI